MRIVLDNCIEGYEVKETAHGLDVYENGNFVLELEEYSFDDFNDEWGKLDEDELYQAIREEEELLHTMDKLAEMR